MKELKHNGQQWFVESVETGPGEGSDRMRVRFFCPETRQEAFGHLPFRRDTFITVPVSTLTTALTDALASVPHRRD